MNIGAAEILVIIVFALIIVGPDKLPAVGKTIGRALGQFRDAQNKVNEVVNTGKKKVEEVERNPFLALSNTGNDSSEKDEEKKAGSDDESAEAPKEKKAASSGTSKGATKEKPSAGADAEAGESQGSESGESAGDSKDGKASRPKVVVSGSPVPSGKVAGARREDSRAAGDSGAAGGGAAAGNDGAAGAAAAGAAAVGAAATGDAAAHGDAAAGTSAAAGVAGPGENAADTSTDDATSADSGRKVMKLSDRESFTERKLRLQRASEGASAGEASGDPVADEPAASSNEEGRQGQA